MWVKDRDGTSGNPAGASRLQNDVCVCSRFSAARLGARSLFPRSFHFRFLSSTRAGIALRLPVDTRTQASRGTHIDKLCTPQLECLRAVALKERKLCRLKPSPPPRAAAARSALQKKTMMEAATQVTVRFVTKLPPQYRVPDDPVVSRDRERESARA